RAACDCGSRIGGEKDLERNRRGVAGRIMHCEHFTPPMTPIPLHSEETCKEIADELTDMVTWLSGGELSPDEFRRTVVTLEARKHQRYGFVLSSSVSDDRMVHFTLRRAGSEEFCASLDVDPATG